MSIIYYNEQGKRPIQDREKFFSHGAGLLQATLTCHGKLSYSSLIKSLSPLGMKDGEVADYLFPKILVALGPGVIYLLK